MVNEVARARVRDRDARRANKREKMMLMASSAGTTATDCEAKLRSLLREMKIKAITIVEGSVPRIPPILVPNFSATTVMMITIRAEKRNGRMI